MRLIKISPSLDLEVSITAEEIQADLAYPDGLPGDRRAV